jgi:preprotein translocase subunit YajC
MRRLLAGSAVALFVAGVLSTSSVTLLAATKTIAGTVSAVSADSITVKAAKEGEMKLTVDTKTLVVGKGVGTKSSQLKEDKKATQIVDFIKAGDEVSVRYDEATKHAEEVRLTKAATPAK